MTKLEHARKALSLLSAAHLDALSSTADLGTPVPLERAVMLIELAIEELTDFLEVTDPAVGSVAKSGQSGGSFSSRPDPTSTESKPKKKV